MMLSDKHKVKFATVRYTKCWFAHLDLMGFTSLVENGDINDVLESYEQALGALDDKASHHNGSGVFYTWFSDTFLIYSKGESIEDFTIVEQISRLFFRKLILNRIPVRGAITYGDFYSQKTRNLFVGPALVDSYKYGEDQKWIGLILTPNAVEKLNALSALEIYRNYRPIPDGIMRKKEFANIRAYNFHCGSFRDGKNGLIESLEEMKAKVVDDIKEKYQLAIDFARQR